MLLTDYSFFMAMLSSSLMIVVLYFLRRTRFFADTFGVGVMLFLYAFSILRMLLPFELPQVVSVIRDTVVLTRVMDVLENRAEITSDLPVPLMYILACAIVFVSLTFISIFVVKYRSYIKRVKALENHATDSEIIKLDAVARSVFSKDKHITLIRTDTVSVPMVTGLVHNILLLPDYDYTDEQLEMIFIHECTHLKNKDLWLKLLVHIYCCLFWFNPFVYLLKADMGFMLELKCDNAVCAQLDEMGRLDYAQVINSCAANPNKNPRATSVMVASGFAFMDGTQQHICRMNNILNYGKHSKKHITPTVLVSLLMALICALSYLFILQASYPLTVETHPEEYANDGNNIISDGTNAYLVKQEDGNYLFYFGDSEVFVPKSHVDKDLYHEYPIYDEKP